MSKDSRHVENWMQHADKHPGRFTAKAHKAGKSVAAYAKKEAHAPGKLGEEARLAEVYEKAARARKR
jgi:hypothetical protein